MTAQIQMSTQIETPKNAEALAETPTILAPEDVVAQLRALRQQIGEVTPLTQQQKKTLRNHASLPNGVVQASINAIASDHVQQAFGQPADAVGQLAEEGNRWTAVEDELRALLNGVAGANLIRRQRVGLLAVQAYVISQQLARDPSNAGLLPHVQEIKRLRSLIRRKKPSPQTPQTLTPPQHVES